MSSSNNSSRPSSAVRPLSASNRILVSSRRNDPSGPFLVPPSSSSARSDGEGGGEDEGEREEKERKVEGEEEEEGPTAPRVPASLLSSLIRADSHDEEEQKQEEKGPEGGEERGAPLPGQMPYSHSRSSSNSAQQQGLQAPGLVSVSQRAGGEGGGARGGLSSFLRSLSSRHNRVSPIPQAEGRPEFVSAEEAAAEEQKETEEREIEEGEGEGEGEEEGEREGTVLPSPPASQPLQPSIDILHIRDEDEGESEEEEEGRTGTTTTAAEGREGEQEGEREGDREGEEEAAVEGERSPEGHLPEEEQKEGVPSRPSSPSSLPSSDFFSDLSLSSSPSLLAIEGEIDEMKRQLELSHIDVALEEKALTAADSLLFIGKMSVEEALAREADVELLKLKGSEGEWKKGRELQERLADEEERIRQELWGEHVRMREELREREDRLINRHNEKVKEEQESFRREEDKLIKNMGKKRAKVEVHLPDINKEEKEGQEAEEEAKKKLLNSMGDGGLSSDSSALSSLGSLHLSSSPSSSKVDMYALVRSRSYTVSFLLSPRILRVRFDLLRAVKNKLPAGRYHLMATLYDRLGGRPLRFSSHQSPYSHTGCTSSPQSHGGRFFNLELSFGQRENRLFLACPAAAETRPGMCLVFELFQCGVSLDSASQQAKQALAISAPGPSSSPSASSPSIPSKSSEKSEDKVVGWAVFPLSQSDFSLISGFYRVPFLRGPIDRSIDKYSSIQRLMQEDLDCWLCNGYFEAKEWERGREGEKKKEVELRFKGEKKKEKKKKKGMAAGMDLMKSLRRKKGGGKKVVDEQGVEMVEWGSDDEEEEEIEGEEEGTEGKKEPLFEEKTADPLLSVTNPRQVAHADEEKEPAHTSLDVRQLEGLSSSLSSSSSSSSSTDRMINVTVKSKAVTRFFRDVPDPLPPDVLTGEELLALRRSADKNKQLALYSFSLLGEGGERKSEEQRWALRGQIAAYKLRYLSSELRADLGLTGWREPAFFLTLLLLFLCIWLRLHTHYMGQYLFLQSARVPILSFTCSLYYCSLLYPDDPQSISTNTQVGVVLIGVLTNIITYIGLLLIVFWAQRALRSFPSLFSRLLLSFGLATLLDPFLILLVDICLLRFSNGDAFKLYNQFVGLEGSGVIGVFITVVIYALCSLLSAILFYLYVKYVHENGRMMDVHERLSGGKEAFYMPNDMEISVSALRWITNKAQSWRGMNGEKRKIVTRKYQTINHNGLRVRGEGAKRKEEGALSSLASFLGLSSFSSFPDLSSLSPFPFSPVPVSSSSSSSSPPLVIEPTVHLSIYTQSLSGDLSLHRHFLRFPSGCCVEIFDAIDVRGEEMMKKVQDRAVESYLAAKRALAAATEKAGGGGMGGTKPLVVGGEFLSSSSLFPSPSSSSAFSATSKLNFANFLAKISQKGATNATPTGSPALMSRSLLSPIPSSSSSSSSSSPFAPSFPSSFSSTFTLNVTNERGDTVSSSGTGTASRKGLASLRTLELNAIKERNEQEGEENEEDGEEQE